MSCPKGKIRNPKSQRYIQIGGPTYNKLVDEGIIKPEKSKTMQRSFSPKKCPKGKILNPKSQRCIQIDGPTYNKLVEEGIIKPERGRSSSKMSKKKELRGRSRTERVMKEDSFEFENMPVETIIDIALNMDPEVLTNFCRTSKYMNNICRTNNIWKKKLLKDFPNNFNEEWNAFPQCVPFEYIYKYINIEIKEYNDTYTSYNDTYTSYNDLRGINVSNKIIFFTSKIYRDFVMKNYKGNHIIITTPSHEFEYNERTNKFYIDEKDKVRYYVPFNRMQNRKGEEGLFLYKTYQLTTKEKEAIDKNDPDYYDDYRNDLIDNMELIDICNISIYGVTGPTVDLNNITYEKFINFLKNNY